ncbi:zinc finger BED domain-containing protein 1-like [Rhizophagus irregularis DAOM 181602=DAOM 197198]|nr:zinc finger BED domain-containing protein 1-like [Rhizophagus irregularis DAOM 181602=DAOM 197198]
MSSEELADIPQPENLETLTCGSKRPRQRVCELLNQQNLAPNGPLIELESDTDSTNNQHKTGKNNKKRNKVSTKTDLNKIADQLVLIPNAKPPGQSWIWSYFEQYEPTEQYRRIVKCLVQVQQKNGVEPCSHFMGSDNSTGNFIVHLSTHRITEESHRRRMSEIRNNNQLSQTRIDEIIRNNPDIKNSRDRKFVGILIKDNRPISICNDEGFVEFIHELDPNYQIPIKMLFLVLSQFTTDLWTARSRNGYIGDNICEVLRDIISNWNLNGKVFTMTTDNGSNMVKAGKLMNELTRLPCTAHTLQLVVGKGLIPAEVLIA